MTSPATRPAPASAAAGERRAPATCAPSPVGKAAGSRGTGYYSFDVGAWHLIALNGECVHVGGCEPGSLQERWLRADLAAHPVTCTPRPSSYDWRFLPEPGKSFSDAVHGRCH